MFTRKFAPDGTLLWNDTFGATGMDMSNGVAVDAHGNIFNVGYTLGELGGSRLGMHDGYVRKYEP